MTKHQFRIVDAFFVVIVTGFILFPLTVALFRAVLSLNAESVNFVFFKILCQSLVYTGVQAAASALIATLLGIGLGTLLALTEGGIGKILAKLAETVGFFAFVLPGVAVAILILNLSARMTWIPSRGLSAIVLAHVMLNFIFVASVMQKRLSAWLDGEGLALCQSARSLGANGSGFWRETFGPVWWDEGKNWFPLIFIWSFTAFSTVIILGGSPQVSTPEVLLFYSLQSDLDSARILILFTLTTLSGLGLMRLVVRKKSANKMEYPLAKNLFSLQQIGGQHATCVKWTAAALLLASGFPFFWLFIDPLRLILRGGRPDPMFWQASLNSLTLGVESCALALTFSLLLFFASKAMRRTLLLGVGLTTTFVATAWITLGWDLLVEQNVSAQIFFAALALALMQIPLCAFWIERRLQSLPDELVMAAQSLGASSRQTVWRLLIPQSRDVLLRIGIFSLMAAVGELALATLFVRDADLISSLGRRMASHYDFSGSAWIILFVALLGLLCQSAGSAWTRA